METRIVLLEDHVLVRHAVALLLERTPDLRVVAQFGSVRELMLFHAEYDLLITDLTLPGPSGISAIRETRQRAPKRRILVLTKNLDEFRAAEAFAAGADGYVTKLDQASHLLEAVASVLRGQQYLSPLLDREAVAALIERCRARVVASGPLAPLSAREREIFDMMIRGYSCQKTASLLFISPRTVDTHRSHIFQKLNVHSQAELLRFAVRCGLLGDETHASDRDSLQTMSGTPEAT